MAWKIGHQAFIDYQRPIGQKNDYRSSSYIGHRYFTDIPSSSVLKTKDVCGIYARLNRGSDHNETETKGHFDWKYKNPEAERYPSIKGSKLLGMKSLDENKFISAPKPLQEYDTIYSQQFKWKNNLSENKVPGLFIPKSVENSGVKIDPKSPGFYKYLDLMTTTNTLNYVNHSEVNQKSISTKDNITIWNWLGVSGKKNIMSCQNELPLNLSSLPESICQHHYSAQCPKRRNEFPSLVKHVPYNGLSTEMKSKYSQPSQKIDFEDKLKYTTNIAPQKSLMPFKTENQIYGSAEKVEKFV